MKGKNNLIEVETVLLRITGVETLLPFLSLVEVSQ